MVKSINTNSVAEAEIEAGVPYYMKSYLEKIAPVKKSGVIQKLGDLYLLFQKDKNVLFDNNG